MMKHRWSPLVVMVAGAGILLALAAAQSAAAQAKPDAAHEQELKALVAVVRGDIRAQRTALINNTMQFNDAEMKAFWPVYRDYEAKLMALNDERLKLIASYGAAAGAITDKDADAMATRALALESKRTSLKQDYYRKLKAAVPIKTAVKALAIEQQIGLLVDLEVAQEVSLRPLK